MNTVQNLQRQELMEFLQNLMPAHMKTTEEIVFLSAISITTTKPRSKVFAFNFYLNGTK